MIKEKHFLSVPVMYYNSILVTRIFRTLFIALLSSISNGIMSVISIFEFNNDELSLKLVGSILSTGISVPDSFCSLGVQQERNNKLKRMSHLYIVDNY